MQLKNKLLPDRFEVILYGLVSLVIVVLGNLEFFTLKLGLIDASTSTSVLENVGTYINEGLAFISSFPLSAAGVVFIFWSMVGVFALSLVNGVSRVYTEIQNDISVSTKFYHPKHYSNAQFWKAVVVDALGRLLLYTVLIFLAYFVSVVIAPIAIIALQDMSSNFTLANVAIVVFAYIVLLIAVSILGSGLRVLVFSKIYES